jgi:DNA-binding beta-propeller fold protein YncE
MKHQAKQANNVFPHLLSALLIALVTAVSTVPTRAAELLVSSDNTGEILRYGGTGGFIDAFITAGAGGLVSPGGLVFGPDGHLYVSSLGTNEVRRYDATTGAFIDAFVTAGSGGLDSPAGLVFGPDGNLYVVSLGNSEVLRYNGTTGAFIDVFASGGLNTPIELTFGPDGHLYVSDFSLSQILRYDGTTGAFIDTFVSTGAGGLSSPWGLVFGPDGNLYVSSFGSSQILRYSVTGAFIDAFVTTSAGGLNSPANVVFGPDGHLYVASFNSEEVLRYNGATGVFIDAFVTAGAGGLNGPWGLLFRGGFLSVSPPSGRYATTQNFDLNLILEVAGPTLSVVGESATFDGADITAKLANCVRGDIVSGGITVRCPGLGGTLLSAAGAHTITVTLNLSDGSSAINTVRWEGVANTEPQEPSRSLFK